MYSLDSNKDLSKVLKGSSLVILQFAILNLTGLIYFSIAARLFSKYDMGLLLFASVIINGLTTLFSFAFNYTASKFCAELLGEGKRDQANAFARIIILLGIFSSLCAVGLGYVITYTIFLPLNVASYYAFLISVDGAINTLMFFFYGVLLGYFEYKKAVLSFSTASGSRFLISSIAIFLGADVITILKIWIIGDLLGLAMMTLFSIRILKGNYAKLSEMMEITKNSIKFSFYLYLSMVLSYIYLYIDRYLVLYNGGLANFAVYGAAITASLILINLPQLISNALLPYFSSILSESKSRFSLIVDSTIRIICTIIVPFIVGIAMLAEPVMYIFAGPKYVEGWFVFFLVTLTIGLTFPIASLTSALLALNKASIIMLANIVAVMIGAVLTQIFYAYLNINGAALGRAALFLISFIIISYWFFLKEKMRYSLSFYLKTSIISLIIFSPLFLISLYKIYTNLFMIIILLIFSFLVYLYILRKYKLLNDNDLENLLFMLPSPISHKLYKFLYDFIRPKSTAIVPYPRMKTLSQYPSPDLYINMYMKPHLQ